MPSAIARIRAATNALLGRSIGYEGAAGGRRFSGASMMPAPIAAQLASRWLLAARARGLVANNALAASGVSAWESALAGSGIVGQSAHPDPAVRKTINAFATRWWDECDADGLADFAGLQRLATRRLVTDGEVFGLMIQTEGGLRVRLIDADQVSGAYHADLPGGSRIVAGIEYDADGRRVAFHMTMQPLGLPIASPYQTVRVSAEDVVHVFRPDVPGQVRGTSWFAPILLRLTDHDAAVDAQLMRQKISAMFCGFIVDANGEGTGFSGTPAPDGSLEAGLEPGLLRVLAPGQDFRQSEPATIGAEAIQFLTVTAHEIAAGLGVPYDQLTGDLSHVNYSSIRAGLVEFRRRADALQNALLIFQFCRPIRRRLITTAILSGELSAPGFSADPEPWLSTSWIVPKTDWVDPAKDVDAEIAAIGAGLMSRRQAVAARGYDLEALDQEIAADHADAKALGLDFSTTVPTPAVPTGVAA